jgi:hypothetical protein
VTSTGAQNGRVRLQNSLLGTTRFSVGAATEGCASAAKPNLSSDPMPPYNLQ